MSGRAPPETLLRDALDAARRENAVLKGRVRELEHSVSALTRSVFVLTTDPAPAAAAGPAGDPRSDRPSPAPPPDPAAAPPHAAPPAAVHGSPLPHAPVRDAPARKGRFTPLVELIDLKAHTAAVYALRFSPDGSKLVTVSFDRSAVVWGIDSDLGRKDMMPLLSIADAHRAPVVAVEWMNRSAGAYLATGGFDASTALWDVAAGLTYPVSRYHTRGIVNAVSTSLTDPFVVYAATGKCAVHRFDRRVRPRAAEHAGTNGSARKMASGSALLSAAARGVHDEDSIVVNNESAVNTVYVEADGRSIITGDHAGAIKTWDLRLVASAVDTGEKEACLVSVKYNDAAHRPITHVHASPPGVGDETGRFMAVNSYDTFLRVYDRGAFHAGAPAKGSDLKPLHALRGVVNRNWPIKSSFYVGPNYRPPRAKARRPPRAPRLNVARSRRSDVSVKSDGLREGGSPPSGHPNELHRDDDMTATLPNPSSSSDLSSEGDQDETFDSTSEEDEDGNHVLPKKVAPYRACETSIRDALILASGSADGNIYLFDVGGTEGTGGVVQTIRGHKDRVHSVEFHPTEPILASCSADAQVKVWTPGKLSQ